MSGHTGFLDKYFDRWIPEPNTGCWLWFGARSGEYGSVFEGGEQLAAHRMAYEDANGVGSLGLLLVRHRCDNPPCVNPDHLLSGTKSDNLNDAYERGFIVAVRGEKHPRSRLTEKQVMSMRELAKTLPVYQIAPMFDVPYSVADHAITGNSWTYLPGAVANPIKDRRLGQPGKKGEDAGRVLLSGDDVRSIRSRLAAGDRSKDLADEYGVHPATIGGIKSGRNWSHLL